MLKPLRKLLEKRPKPLQRLFKKPRFYSYRDFPEPEEWIERAEEEGRREQMLLLREVESGRFHEMLEEGHKFFSNLDPDERRKFSENHPHFVKWLGVFGYLEEIPTFEEYSGIESSFR